MSSEVNGSIGTIEYVPVALICGVETSGMPPKVMEPPFELFEESRESAIAKYGLSSAEARFLLTLS